MQSPGRLAPEPAGYRAAEAFLTGRIDYERIHSVPYLVRNFKLKRMRDLLDRLGNPHRAFPAVHVAGTKGKGSTTAMLGAILAAAGYRLGAFTSPHLDHVSERITIDGEPCSAADFVELVDRVAPAVEAMDAAASRQDPAEAGPTYFEVVTAMAFLQFARRTVDMAVLEVGLGGRLDSTNVCEPEVSVITSISLDHTKLLGSTTEAICREKAGIIKRGIPVVSGVTQSGPRGVIRDLCQDHRCRLAELGVDFHFDYRPARNLQARPSTGRLDFRRGTAESDRTYGDLPLNLPGHHQAANAAVALAVVCELEGRGWEIPEEAIRTGLANLVWPARSEIIGRRPAIVVDAAHNGASVEALLRVLDESFSVRRRHLLFATTQDKDVGRMLWHLLPRFDEVVLTRYLENPRSVAPEELERIGRRLTGRGYATAPTPADAWKRIRAQVSAEDLVCVTGSFFIVAEMRRLLQSRQAE